jgi:hypothetical protein
MTEQKDSIELKEVMDLLDYKAHALEYFLKKTQKTLKYYRIDSKGIPVNQSKYGIEGFKGEKPSGDGEEEEERT